MDTDTVLTALQQLRDVQAQMLDNEQRLRAAVAANNGEAIQALQRELADLFASSSEAYQSVRSELLHAFEQDQRKPD